jgi:hypothetical protein
MEPVIIAIGGLAAGWAIWKTGSAISTLRAQRRQAASGGRGYEDSASLGNFVGGSTSGDSGHSHGGDCGGHGGGHGGH